MSMTPEQRTQRASIAANARLAKTTDLAALTAPAREAFLARFEREVDPDGVLPPAERSRRAEYAKRAHMKRMALASSRSRAAKAAARRAAQSSGEAA
jgi:hypothetical protein